MKTLLTLLTTLALGFSAAMAADDDTPLAKEMAKMNKALRTLKRQIADPAKKADNLELVKNINTAVIEACKLEPKKTKDVPAAEKTAYLTKYKEQMDSLGKTFSELETAIKADNQDDAKKALAKLSDLKETGHKDFGADDE